MLEEQGASFDFRYEHLNPELFLYLSKGVFVCSLTLCTHHTVD